MPQGLLPFSSEHPHKRFFDKQRRGCLAWMRARLAVTRPRTARIFFIGVLTCCLLIYFLCIRSAVENDYFIEEPAQFVPEEIIERRADFHSSTIDRMCSETTKVCYTVMDKRTPDEVVERHLLIDGTGDESDTVVRLIAPKGQSFESSDTRIWNIDHRYITAQYVAGMLVAPFLVSSLPLEGPGNGESVLEIGLGGGSLDMALAELKPKIKISAVELDGTVIKLAEKWFGVASSKNRKHIEGDGIEVMREMKAAGEKVDVLVLDACDDAKEVPCPAAAFLQQDVIENMKALMTERGVLVVNILAHDDEGETWRDAKAISAFTDVFPSCLQLKMTTEINVILVCLPYSIGDSEEQLRFYSTRLRTAVASIGLQYILGNVAVSHS